MPKVQLRKSPAARVERRPSPSNASPVPDRRLTASSTRYSVQSLMVGLGVLEALVASGKDRGVTELATALGTTKWRIFRHLHTLCQGGYVSQDPETGRFRLGRRTYALLRSLPDQLDFVPQARADMLALRDQRGHTVVLAAPVDETGVVVLEAIEGTHVVQFSLKVGATFDLHASAHGKAALAFGPGHWLDRVIARGLRRHTEHTITEPRALRREVEKIRGQGWASAYEESFGGVNTVVAPIFAAKRGFVGTVAIFGSTEAIPRVPAAADVDAVKNAAQRISQKLGWK